MQAKLIEVEDVLKGLQSLIDVGAQLTWTHNQFNLKFQTSIRTQTSMISFVFAVFRSYRVSSAENNVRWFTRRVSPGIAPSPLNEALRRRHVITRLQ